MKIIDNFLTDDVFKKIYDIIMGTNIDWHFSPTVAYSSEKEIYENYVNSHLAYTNNQPQSNIYQCLLPLIEDSRLEVKSLMRIIINMYPYTTKIKIHGEHIDYPFKHKGAILYLNSCDGYTFCEGQKVYSKSNRVLLHDPSKYHHSTTTSNKQRRVICNLNYF